MSEINYFGGELFSLTLETICIFSCLDITFSTETARLKIQSDIVSLIDEDGSVVILILVLLDSTAFDTINHAFIDV